MKARYSAQVTRRVGEGEWGKVDLWRGDSLSKAKVSGRGAWVGGDADGGEAGGEMMPVEGWGDGVGW